MTKKYIVGLKVLPGEPLDGSGRACIHLFIPDKKGSFEEPSVTQLENNKLTTKPARGRLACDPKRLVAPVVNKGVTNVTLRTDSPRAANCPKCLASEDYKRLMKMLEPNKETK